MAAVPRFRPGDLIVDFSSRIKDEFFGTDVTVTRDDGYDVLTVLV
jgi:hypothetical protein